MLQMIQYQTGERRVIDTRLMIASDFLHAGDLTLPLAYYELDCDLDPADLEPPYSVLREE